MTANFAQATVIFNLNFNLNNRQGGRRDQTITLGGSRTSQAVQGYVLDSIPFVWLNQWFAEDTDEYLDCLDKEIKMLSPELMRSDRYYRTKKEFYRKMIRG
jgi:hypothetical protein